MRNNIIVTFNIHPPTMYHISLGPDCSIAYHMQQNKIKKETLPFDWTSTPNLNKLLELIKNKFNLFFDYQVGTASKFITLDDDWDDQCQINKIYIKNYRYNISFPHDNLDNFNFIYTKRIERFMNIIKDNNNKKIFYRIGKDVDKIKICKILDEMMIVNYEVIIIKNNTNDDNWKRNNIDWKKIFNLEKSK